MWLTLSADLKVSSQILARRCLADKDVIIADGSLFDVPGESESGMRFDRNMRLCWAWEDEWKLKEGVKRIGEVVISLSEKSDYAETADNDLLVASKGRATLAGSK